MNRSTDNISETPLDSAISAALKEPAAAYTLPRGFSERFVGCMMDAPKRSRLPRWLKKAACFALLLSGAAFAAIVVVDAVTAKDDGRGKTVGSAVPGAPQADEGADVNAALAAAETEGPRFVEPPVISDVPSDETTPAVPSQSSSLDNQLENGKGENEMNIKWKAVAALAAAALSDSAYAADYTWMASPADAEWNASSLNWNSGVAWEDNASAPNNAVFPSASSQKTIAIPSGQTRYVNNLDMRGAYTIQGDGKLDLVGKFSVNSDCTLNAAFDCQTVRFGGTSGKVLKFDSKAQNSTHTSTYIDGSVWLNIYGDKSFGTQPTQPTDNIFITSGTPTILTWVPWSTSLNKNRIIRISPNAGLALGGNTASGYTNTIKSLILADNSPGQAFSTNTVVSIPPNWTGQRVLDPGDGRTNIIGRLKVESRLKIASGVTRLGSAKIDTGSSAMLYINGNGSSYSGTKGSLEIAGGTLYASQTRYVDVSNYGQVTVKDGGRVYMPRVTWLNGLSGRGRLTVANGDFLVSTLRIKQSANSEVHLEEGGLIAVNVLEIEQSGTTQGLFKFNGGRLLARDGTDRGAGLFSSATEASWRKVRFAIGEGGAVFDTDNGQNIWWTRPLVSDAVHDGGVKKLGGSMLIFTNTNSYNGVTHVVAGGMQLRTDNALPPGSTLRLGGGVNPYIDAWTFENASPARATEQWLSRVEGTGSINNCTKLHVTNSIAPAVDGRLSFDTRCDLRGNLEISGNANGCGCMEIAAGQNISGLTLNVCDISTFNKDAPRDTYKVLDAPDGYTGEKFAADNLGEQWRVKYTETGAFICRRKGLAVILR
ncbi:MAG: hypothetical protein K6G91_12670 [Kiritimatiellae bacterium]|nr:hypothetical protein [Kiritimatiellia bacterium]